MLKDVVSENKSASVRNPGPEYRRNTLLVHVTTSDFLDLIAKCTLLSKAALSQRVWRAGLAEVFGVTEDELKECQMVVPRLALGERPEDLMELTNIICGE
jgi:hypothetical protein